VNGAYRISSVGQQRVHDVKAAIAAGHPVIFGTEVDNAIFDVASGQVWPGCVGPSIGGHAILITGFAPSHFEICNSWGSTYSDRGFFLASESAIASGAASDFWVLDMAQPFSEAA
jgi:C1A family cysteine protease